MRNMVWIWGVHAVIAALENRIEKVEKIFITEKYRQKIYDILSKKRPGICQQKKEDPLSRISIEIIPMQKLDQLFGQNHQGIAIYIEQIKFWQLNEWITAQMQENSLLIACDLIEDPHNLGAIIRTAAAFNANGILITANKQAPFNGTLFKSAAGGIEHIPIVQVVNLATSLKVLQKEYYMIFGLDGTGVQDWQPFLKKNKINKNVLIFGQEGKGLRDLTKKSCDMLLAINTNENFPVLNVSVAAGVAIARFSGRI